MTELGGKLDGVGLLAIVRFLIELKKTGTLHVTHQDWHGEVFFENGGIAGATIGSRSGLAALDALVESFPGASFAFDSQAAPTGEPSIRLSEEALLAHLVDLATRLNNGIRTLPPADGVPVLVVHQGSDEEPLPLDRATLQTLLAVDGQRTVRDIVTQRGSFDALWQLANLIDVGLIEISTAAPRRTSAVARAEHDASEPAIPLADSESEPTPKIVRTFAISLAEPTDEAIQRCPKLGFEDDPANSVGRPTRLHRCFAAAAPLRLSFEQQRELCLSDQFGTCPRLNRIPEDPRIVRLPFGARHSPPDRDGGSGNGGEPTRLRVVNDTSDNGRPPAAVRPTPLRARLERAANTSGSSPGAVAAPPRSGPVALSEESAEQPPTTVTQPAARRFGRSPVLVIAGFALVVAVLAVLAYLLHPDTLFGEDSIDASALPNTTRIAAGTPVAAVTSSRTSAGQENAKPTQVAGAAAQSADGPQAMPGVAQITQGPAMWAQSAVPQRQSGPTRTSRTLLDERFSANDANWPSNPEGVAWLTNGSYRVGPKQPGQFVAIAAPVANPPEDVVITATFRKLGGPPGGGYGIIVRDQGLATLDGTTQDGRYIVLEVGDKGEIGIWRREADHWVDLLPWQRSDAVKTGATTNELSVRAIGNTFTLLVNGAQVATRTDGTLSGGRVGLFVGGDGNQVAVERFTIQAP